MPVLSDYLNSPAWWITAVVFALLLNIVGNYTQRWIDRWGGRLSTRWATRTAAKTHRRAQLIAAVRTDAGRLMWVGFQAQSLKTSSFLLFFFAVLLLLFGFVVPGMDEVARLFLLLGTLPTMVLGVSLSGRAAELEAVIRAVEPEWPEPPSA